MNMEELVAERFATRSRFFRLIIDVIGGHETEFGGYLNDDGSRLELQPPCIAKGLWRLWRSGSFTKRGAGSLEFRRDEAIIVCDADLPDVAAWLAQLYHHVRAPFPLRKVHGDGQVFSHDAWRAR